jgi:hypothetical protein
MVQGRFARFGSERSVQKRLGSFQKVSLAAFKSLYGAIVTAFVTGGRNASSWLGKLFVVCHFPSGKPAVQGSECCPCEVIWPLGWLLLACGLDEESGQGGRQRSASRPSDVSASTEPTSWRQLE